MTTTRSLFGTLKVQADKIAAALKAAERNEKINEKIVAARDKEIFKIGIMMDDKVITIEMPWATIRGTSEAGLAEYILKQMRGSPDIVH